MLGKSEGVFGFALFALWSRKSVGNGPLTAYHTTADAKEKVVAAGDGSYSAGDPTAPLGSSEKHDGSSHSLEDGGVPAGGPGEPPVPCPPHTTERQLMARVDLRLVPFVVVLYLLAFLDRVNIANANSFGLSSDLGLAGVQFNTALTIFFVPYVVLEIPSNVLLKRLSPRLWLSLCGLGFGLVSIFQGLTRSYGGLITTRFFLGVFECGMFPGCFYLLGMWYKRSEAQKRFSLFFGSTSLAGAFGGLLASAIGKMDGMRGYGGWRWIFIIEGALTVVVCIVFFFTFPSFPEQATWLREDERAFIKARLQADQGRNAAERQLAFRDALSVLRDYKVWLGGLMYFGLIVPAYGYAYFSPAIISSYNYSPIQTQLHSVPPWAAAFAFAMAVAWASDAARHRLLFALGPIALAAAGLVTLLAVHDDTVAEYAALFLVCAGTYSAMPVIVCWFNMNLGGHRRRAVGTAWQIGFGNIGGIVATYSFLGRDRADHYRTGYAICLSFVGLSAASCAAYAAAVAWENRRRDGAAAAGVHAGLTEDEKAELGDLNPEFRYML